MSRMVVMMDLDKNQFPATALVLLSVSIDNITSINIDVSVVIGDYHHLLTVDTDKNRLVEILPGGVSHQMSN